MTDAITLLVRYDTRDETGESRRERNARFETASPTLIIPPAGEHIWEWYFQISRRLARTRDGICYPIPHSEFLAWRHLTGQVVYPAEYDILCAMDDAYCAAMGDELAEMRARQQEARPDK